MTTEKAGSEIVRVLVGDLIDSGVAEILLEILADSLPSSMSVIDQVIWKDDEILDCICSQDFELVILVANNILYNGPRSRTILKQQSLELIEKIRHASRAEILVAHGFGEDTHYHDQVKSKGVHFVGKLPIPVENFQLAIRGALKLPEPLGSSS
jgi:hypothetical protein